MNVVVIVEGEIGAKKIYQTWIPLANPSLVCVHHISDIRTNNFCVIYSGGRPGFFDRIKEVALDINQHGNIDKYIVAVDAEDYTLEQAQEEMSAYLESLDIIAEKNIIIQYYCFESWALGNRRICRRKPRNQLLKKYYDFFNVITSDPELMPPFPEERLNRAQFSSKYLRYIFTDRKQSMTYNKNNPGVLLHEKYYQQLAKRLEETGHIHSFSSFISSFQ